MKVFSKKNIFFFVFVCASFIACSSHTYAQTATGTVDLITEPLTYIPPFYKGKPDFSHQSTVKIVAMPEIYMNGRKLNKDNLYFKWKKNDVVAESASGFGKNYFLASNDILLADADVALDVLDSDFDRVASGFISLQSNEPEVLFYEDSPLYGILFNAAIVDNYEMGSREELGVIAIPFSFGFRIAQDANATYDWTMNQNPVIGQKNKIFFRQETANKNGRTNIGVEIKNKNFVMQRREWDFNVHYGI